jgi:hypothetical protein
VVALVVVVLDEGLDLGLKVAGQEVSAVITSGTDLRL